MTKRDFLLCISLLFVCFCDVYAQDPLYGIRGNSLVEVDPTDASLTEIATLSQPIGDDLEAMTYVTHTEKFYSILFPFSNPQLVSIELDGTVEVIGPISLPGRTIYLIEAIGYNNEDCGFYISASLNGGPSSGDYYSESILFVDPETAEAEFVTDISTVPSRGPDIDMLAFWNDTMIIIDANPSGPAYEYIFKLTIEDNMPAVSYPTQLYYVGQNNVTRSMTVTDNKMYTTRGDFHLYECDLTQSSLSFTDIGQTHNSSQGPTIDNLAVFRDSLEVGNVDVISDTIVCKGNIVHFDLPLRAQNIQWNTGDTTHFIEIDTSVRPLTVTYSINLCAIRTDTADIQIIDCDTCIFNGVDAPQIMASADTACLDDSVRLSLPVLMGVTPRWSTNVTSNQITVTNSGDYWAEYRTDLCTLYTDTVSLTFVDCDSCGFERNQSIIYQPGVENPCVGDSVYLRLPLSDTITPVWNNGDTSTGIWVKYDGSYWGIYQNDLCTLASDTVNVQFDVCGECLYYIPNAFSPNDDEHNNVFRVWFTEEFCDPSISMIIYNRWGEKVYQSEINEWNGLRDDGSSFPQDVYTYKVLISYPLRGESLYVKEEVGTVTLVN